jgi:hypothetical protein
MVVDRTPIFDNCVIKTNKPKPLELSVPLVYKAKLENLDEGVQGEGLQGESEGVQGESEGVQGEGLQSKSEREAIGEGQDKLDKLVTMDDIIAETQDNENNEVTLEVEELGLDEIKEVSPEVNLDDLGSITLRNPNEVYFDLYREARNKAKQAKRSAIIAYLEAKNIKKTYMLDNLNDSDSEFDAEIDEASESELEGL